MSRKKTRLEFVSCCVAVIAMCVVSAAAQEQVNQVEAANGERFAVSATNKNRNADQLVRYTVDYYRKNTLNAAGVDVYIVKDKVAEIRDRAGAVYLEKKPDPGAIGVGKDGYVLSGNGAARKWIIANLKVGDAVKLLSGAPTQTVAANAGKEVPPAKEIACFPGAYYRKAVSSLDTWTGIIGTVKLGTPKVDEARLDPKDNQPLDNFSVYMGGRAGEKEIDAGLTWEFTTDATGKRSERRNGWRPFWRNETWHSAPDDKNFYWYPGDTVTMAVLVAAPGKLRLIVADASPNPQRVFQTEFDARSFAPNIPRQFKRVNAIDQRYNEGKPAQPTAAQVTGAAWLETFLLRGAGASVERLPMTPARMTDMRCPAVNQISVIATDAERAQGAEKIDIHPGKK